MVGQSIFRAVQRNVKKYDKSRLATLVIDSGGPYAIKFVKSRWAINYLNPARLKISETPALTWGTATYVTPLAFPLSSALYGRIGLVVCRKVTITSCYASKLVWRQTAKCPSPVTNVRNSAASLNLVPCRPATSFAPSSS